MKSKSGFKKFDPTPKKVNTEVSLKDGVKSALNEERSKKGSILESFLHSEHTVEIEKMAIGGDGVARIQADGKSLVVFVSKSAPKDVLKVKIVGAEKNFLVGNILEVITPGPARRLPPCVYANSCGGCSWQQFSEDEQVHQKELLLKELFAKFLPNESLNLESTVRSPEIFHYRNRIQLKQIGTQLGYFQDKTHDIVDIQACLIADKRISDEIPNVKKSLRPSLEIKKFELKINQNEKFEYYPIGEHGEGLSFSQVNTGVNIQLVSEVVKIFKGLQAKSAIELFAGAGNFTFPIAEVLPNDCTIQAVEMNPALTTAATKVLQTKNLQKKVVFFTSDCDSYVERRSLKADVVFVDPPRQGCSDKIIDKLKAASPKEILYVSCHPVSLVRDLQKLDFKSKGYHIEKVRIFDMFPQTDHFETLIWLRKK